MVAVAWAAIGLLGATLAVLVAALFRLGDRIDAQGARSEALARDLVARIDALARDLGARIDAQTARIDALSSRMDAHLERHAG